MLNAEYLFPITCFAIRQVKPYMALEALKTIYFSYFSSIVTYGIIFWGNSVHSQYIFKIQKRMIRFIANLGVRDSCRCVFKELGFLPLYSQYLYSLLMFRFEISVAPTTQNLQNFLSLRTRSRIFFHSTSYQQHS